MVRLAWRLGARTRYPGGRVAAACALLAGLAAVFVIVYLAVNLLLQFVVLRPIRRLSAMADEVSTGNMDIPEYKPRGRDEIASLAQSFNRMRRSVANALRLLER